MKKIQMLTLRKSGAFTILFSSFAMLLLLTSIGCTDDIGEQKKPQAKYAAADGVFVICEGQFMAGNGSVSWYQSDKKLVTSNVFFGINNRPPGDIPQFLCTYKETGYLVVNNSNTIEVVDLLDFKVKTTISGLNMPRQILVSGTKGYVSQIGSSKVVVIDLNTNQILGEMEGFKSSDRMVNVGKHLFVANWTSYFIDKPNNTIMVFNTDTDQFVDSVVVAKEPNSMVVDKNDMIWVLSSGGYMGEEYPAITCIDPLTLKIVKTLVFPDKSAYPSLLSILDDGETLCYVNGGVYQLNITDQILPSTPFIPSDGRSVYGFSADPVSGDLYLCDAIDYQQDGEVYRYSSSGVLKDVFTVGINPSGVFFYKK